jgi:hypothetical protein
MPKKQELYDYMDKKFGSRKQEKWLNIDFVKQEEDESINNFFEMK